MASVTASSQQDQNSKPTKAEKVVQAIQPATVDASTGTAKASPVGVPKTTTNTQQGMEPRQKPLVINPVPSPVTSTPPPKKSTGTVTGTTPPKTSTDTAKKP